MVRVFSLSVVLILLATLLPGCQSAADALAAPGHARSARNSPPGANLAQEPLDEFVYLPLVLRGMTLTLVADRTSITLGQCVTLSWVVQGAVAVTLNGASVPASGSGIYCPSMSTLYTLSAVDALGNTASTSLIITVTYGY
jgi:hypothetical protein